MDRRWCRPDRRRRRMVGIRRGAQPIDDEAGRGRALRAVGLDPREGVGEGHALGARSGGEEAAEVAVAAGNRWYRAAQKPSPVASSRILTFVSRAARLRVAWAVRMRPWVAEAARPGRGAAPRAPGPRATAFAGIAPRRTPSSRRRASRRRAPLPNVGDRSAPSAREGLGGAICNVEPNRGLPRAARASRAPRRPSARGSRSRATRGPSLPTFPAPPPSRRRGGSNPNERRRAIPRRRPRE